VASSDRNKTGTLVDAPVVADFAQALEPANYVSVPSDWLIAVADVVGSTGAISAGRYKDVNLAGAATIAGIQNASPGRELPFAFGGDGGIVLVPPDLSETTTIALQGVQHIVRNTLSLDTRCALIPVAAVRADGFDVRLAYQALHGSRRLAMLCGGGIDHAETLCKSAAGERFAITADATTEDADLSGLSCRWRHHRAQRRNADRHHPRHDAARSCRPSIATSTPASRPRRAATSAPSPRRI
jgi:hypothetical protein